MSDLAKQLIEKEKQERTGKLHPGLYRHFKGNLYQVIGTATHSETMEEMAVYVPQYGERKMWVRPLAMFQSTVVHEGKEVPRFERIGD
jgi:hypothetical protein